MHLSRTSSYNLNINFGFILKDKLLFDLKVMKYLIKKKSLYIHLVGDDDEHKTSNMIHGKWQPYD